MGPFVKAPRPSRAMGRFLALRLVYGTPNAAELTQAMASGSATNARKEGVETGVGLRFSNPAHCGKNKMEKQNCKLSAAVRLICVSSKGSPFFGLFYFFVLVFVLSIVFSLFDCLATVRKPTNFGYP